MESSKRFPWWVLITFQGLCAVGLLAGIFALVSPFWFPAGVIGLLQGYNREVDILGIVWLAGSLGSMFIGVLLMGTAAMGAIWTGIAVGIGGLAMRKIPAHAPQEETPANQGTSDQPSGALRPQAGLIIGNVLVVVGEDKQHRHDHADGDDDVPADAGHEGQNDPDYQAHHRVNDGQNAVHNQCGAAEQFEQLLMHQCDS